MFYGQKKVNECDKDGKKSVSQSYLSLSHIPLYEHTQLEKKHQGEKNN